MDYVFFLGGKVNLSYVCILLAIKLKFSGCYKRTKNEYLTRLIFNLCIEGVNLSFINCLSLHTPVRLLICDFAGAFLEEDIMSSSVIFNKICRSTGLRVRPFVNAIGSQFVPILHTTVGVSCY